MSAFYNEIDAHCVEWLGNLCEAGKITNGCIDSRSIESLSADDLAGYERCHFFAGFGLWDVALNLAGWRGRVWSGSCPCQPFSAAGKGGAFSDERDLWPAWYRLIRIAKPPAIFGEEVDAAIGWGWFDRVCDDLEREGYAVAAAVLPACSVGAPHIRNRLFWVAKSPSTRCSQERKYRGGSPSLSPRLEQCGGTDGLGDTCCERVRAKRCSENGSAAGAIESSEKEREWLRADAWTASEPSGLADSNNSGREWTWKRIQNHSNTSSRDDPQRGSTQNSLHRRNARSRDIGGGMLFTAASSVGVAEETRRCPISETDRQSDWTASEPIYCRDGKYRRIPLESRIQPLDAAWDGTLSRVSVLRAAGNSIVPQVAAEFIRAVSGAD